MSALAYEERDGKARYHGRTLSEWVPTVVDQIVEAADPERVVLFGSIARGDDGPDSDLDLMVVLDSIDYTRRRLEEARLRASLEHSLLPVQIVVTDERECRRRRDVVGSMHYWPLREGLVVYARAP